ncbi:MAG: zinc ABC transporter substrate-binding protein [Dehalococcoidia bacterium]|nr:zinc ABC transporter substrate-binding protein [Dehalococcoidia bacterium]
MILNRVKGIPGLLSGFLLIIGLLFVTAACSGEASTATPTATTSPDPTPTSTPTPVPPTPVKVTTTTNIVADWVENIGGDHVDVFSLLPVGADPHGFQPGARDVANIADADLVLSIGLGLEESWMRDLLESAARDPSSFTERGNMPK